MIGPIRPQQPSSTRAPARAGGAPHSRSGDDPLEGSRTHDGVVRYGSLEVPVAHAHDFEQAAKYLGRDPKMRAVLERAQHLDHPLHLAINGNDDDSYDALTQTVNWDPHSALQTSSGGRQSPAMGLGHELDHATVDPAVRTEGSWKFDADYDNAEERRVIEGSEKHAARTLGEDVRHDHRGTPYSVASPILRRIA